MVPGTPGHVGWHELHAGDGESAFAFYSGLFGWTKAEVRVMYVWLDKLTPVLTIIRMGRGLMMGVDHNKNMEWVGASAGLYLDE